MIEITKKEYEELLKLMPRRGVIEVIREETLRLGYPPAFPPRIFKIRRLKGKPEPKELKGIIDILVEKPLFFGGEKQNAIIIENKNFL